MAEWGLPDAVARLSTGTDAFLGAHHLETARRLQRLFERAQIRQRVTMSYDPGRAGGGGKGAGMSDLADTAADARQRLGELARRVPADCWNVLTDVCGLDLGLQDIETRRAWPRRGAKLVLRIGLDQLAQLWGLDRMAEGRETARTRGWLPQRLPMFGEKEEIS